MKNFFALLLVLIAHAAQANNYYFSSVSGDDSRTAAEAQNPATPWKTTGKLNSYFSSFQPGDSALLKRNEIFYGSVTVGKSGIKGSPIVIGAYGTGSKPVVTGLTTLTNWIAVGNGIYECYNATLGSDINMMLLNDVQEPIGRYPNTGYLTFESHSGSTSITDSELPSSPNWTGAELVLRSAHWQIDRHTISSHSGNTIYYPGGFAPRDNYGYFIQNSVKTLDEFGEWAYNENTKKVSMFFGTKSPASCKVMASNIANLVYASGKSYVKFDNITFKGANEKSIVVNSGSGFSVENCDVLFSGIDAVSISNHSYFSIENCNIINSNNNGIAAGGTNTYATIRNNTIRNTSAVVGMGQSGGGQGAGIRIASYGLVEYNKIINSGYVGMNMVGDYTVTKNNYIDTFCNVKDDGAGIYLSNGNNLTNKGRKITGNIVLNGIGAPIGTDAPSTASAAEGIYMDDDVNGVEMTGNTVSNCNRGIFLHNSRQIIVKNNTSYNNKYGQLHMKYDGLGDPLRNHTITNNIFFSKFAKHTVLTIISKADDIDSIGRLDSNYYARPIDDRTVISVSSSGNENTLDLEGWKLMFKKDASSKRSAKQIASYSIGSFVGSNKYAYGSFDASYDAKRMYPNSCTTTWQNSGTLDGGYVKVAPSASSSSVVLGIGALTAGKKYILKYSVKGTASAMSIGAYLRASSTGDYKGLTGSQYRSLSTVRSNNEMVFAPSKDEASGSLVFFVDAQNDYYIDNIQLFEAEATVTNPDDSIKFVFNPEQVAKTVSLNGNYVDVKNNKFSNSIVLQPFQSAVLIKNGVNENTEPTVTLTSPVANANVAAPASVTITANAADSDGTVSKVEFYNGTTLLGIDYTSPYTFTWNNVQKGKYLISAKATDNDSLTATSTVAAISVYAPNVAPSVSLTSPVADATIATPASVTISANATDSDGTISRVEFYNGNILIGTEISAPYTFTWNNVAAGTYSITAKAIDNGSLETTSAAAAFTVYTPNVAPSVSLTSPVANAAITTPASVTISADAADTDGSVSKVQFYSNDTLIGTAAASPYTFTWNNVPVGTYTITAKATDNGSLVTTSAPVAISVSAPKVAPSVSLTSPVADATVAVPASVTISADAADTDGSVSKVQFYSNDTLIGTAAASPYTFTWNNVPAGSYTITARAFDNDSLVTVSSPVAFSVYTPNVAPSVALTSPVASAKNIGPATITIAVAATDADGTVSKVEFYKGTTLLKTLSAAPYTFSWTNVAAGSYTITAKATDNTGAVTVSAPVAVTVMQNTAPSVSLTSPVVNAVFNGPAIINLSAVAGDADGSVSKVEFYNGTTLLCTERVAPYSYSWLNVAPGNYTIVAKATDNKGAITKSVSVAVSVVAPSVSLKSSEPADTTTITDNTQAVNLATAIAEKAKPELTKLTADTTTIIDNAKAINLARAIAEKAKPELANVKLFPNPAINKINITLNGLQLNNKKAFLLIQNTIGIVVKNIPVTIAGNIIEADVNALTAGMYTATIVSDNVKFTKKFIKN